MIVYSLYIAFTTLVVSFTIFTISDSISEENARVFSIVLVITTTVLVSLGTWRIGIYNAETKMYEQIRDDVNITNHKLYKKWLIDNPKDINNTVSGK